MQKVVEMKFGAHLYGLQTENSDTDYKGIYLPSVKDLVFGAKESKVSSTGGEGKNTKDDIDVEWVSLQKFIKDALAGQTYTIDMLHCTQPEMSSPVWEFIVENRHKFYTNNMKAYIGYVKQQAAKYVIKGSRLSDIKIAIDHLSCILEYGDTLIGKTKHTLFTGRYAKFETIRNDKTNTEETYYVVNNKKYQLTNSVEYVRDRLRQMYDSYGERAKMAMNNEGVDWKALSHALRAGYQLRAIYKDGDFSYPLQENEFILNVKTGKVIFREVSKALEDLVEEIEHLSSITTFPDSPDHSFWFDYVYSLYE